MTTELDKAHRAIRSAADDLEREGVAVESICDALMVTAINGAARMTSAEIVANWLDEAAALIRSGQKVTGRKN